ncbi:MAG TPA: hypothetical protein VK423_04120 [Thermoplasmata archaeon]|nr:hypothetical protein [Thermoplasmata archaeon]
MASKKGSRAGKSVRRSPPRRKAPARVRFVGRESSPVLDRYPPKDPSTAPRGPPPVALSTPPSTAPSSGGVLPVASSSAAPGQPLITLDRPFDVDDFSTLLGGTSIRITVPRDALPEVLRRVTEFMGFGIYVYSISVRPAATELLKGFVVELQRVDFSVEKGAWVPFVEKGMTDSPFGPSGDRT